MTPPGTGPPPPALPVPPAPRQLLLGDLLIGFGGLAVFGFSFAPFVAYGDRAAAAFGLLDVPLSFNAWSLQTFMVPLTTFVILAALLGIGAVAGRFGLRRDPERLGFRLRQVEVGLALFGFVVLLGMVASDKHVIVGARQLAAVDSSFQAREVAMDTGWGAVLMLIGATVVLAGALLNHFGLGPAVVVAGQPSPPPPEAWPAPEASPPPEAWPAGPSAPPPGGAPSAPPPGNQP